MKTVAIVNPFSGKKSARTLWPVLLDQLGPKKEAIETWWTEYPGHAEVLAASARRSGCDRVIAVGGDGTLLEVLNGLWWEGQGSMPSVGMVPLGTGCDYVRNFEVGTSHLERLRTAVGEKTIRVSLGTCKVMSSAGKRDRVFAMVLGLGFDAEVIRRFRTIRPIRFGWFAYALSGLLEIGRLRSHKLAGTVDGLSYSADAIFLGVALGSFFGKGIEIAPGLSPCQSRFMLVRAAPMGPFRLSSLILLRYLGIYPRNSMIVQSCASRIVLDSNPPALIEADGELLGQTPLEAEIIPEAFCFAAKKIRIIQMGDVYLSADGEELGSRKPGDF
jgi:diacylglycerol kinase (ATP)